jgi:hypothetical protein
MLKTNKQIKKILFTALFAVFVIPTLVSADKIGLSGSGSWSPASGSGWNYGSGSYSSPVSYTNYSYTPRYSTPSYSGSYTPSYGGYSYGGYSLPIYSGLSYSGSSIPGSGYVSNSNTNTNTSSSNSTSSSSATAINNNVNNVYVYTNPTGNAVVHNPQHQYINVYCTITPSNPRVGQAVTATAYATGGIGNYTYTWSGDINTVSGPSTTFTSYTTGTKNITVTVRSGQEIMTRSCDVTFVNDNQNNNDISAVCFANPTNATVNQVVTWTVNVNGGNSGFGYTYNWSGTDGLNGFNQFTSRQYTYAGVKNAFVTVTGNGRTVTANCSTNVNNFAGASFTGGSSVNLTPNITTGTPVSGVFLGDLPATGLSLGFVEYMVGFMTIILAIVFTFIYQARKRLMIENA